VPTWGKLLSVEGCCACSMKCEVQRADVIAHRGADEISRASLSGRTLDCFCSTGNRPGSDSRCRPPIGINTIESGALVADLHLWNEHIPPMPKGGPDLVWARQVSTQVRRSLDELARNFASTPELKEAQACRARTNFLGHGRSSESLSRVIKRFGFEEVDEGSPAMPTRIHDLFENVLIAALVWTHNPEALRSDKCIRQRRPVWMPRDKLLGLYGGR